MVTSLALALLMCRPVCGRAEDAAPLLPEPQQLLVQAAKAKGKAYFTAKRRLLEADPLGKRAQTWLADASLPWDQRQVARALVDQAAGPQAYDQAAMALAGLLVKGRRRESRRPPDRHRHLWYRNPLEIPAGSEIRQTFEQIGQQTGLVYEVLFKHTPTTISEYAAAARAERLAEMPESEKRYKGGELKPEYAIGTKQWSTSLTDRDRTDFLFQAHIFAMRLLVLSDSADAIALLKASASTVQGKQSHGAKRAVDCLRYIGNKAAKEALAKLGTTRAKSALIRLRKEEAAAKYQAEQKAKLEAKRAERASREGRTKHD